MFWKFQPALSETVKISDPQDEKRTLKEYDTAVAIITGYKMLGLNLIPWQHSLLDVTIKWVNEYSFCIYGIKVKANWILSKCQMKNYFKTAFCI